MRYLFFMLRFIEVLWILFALTTAYGRQVPIQISKTAGRTSQETDAATWDLSRRPGVNTTSNLLFDTVNSLLQHWPNTRYRNGHNIVPGTVPLGTLLYHGTRFSEVPTVPEWLATDPEHSYVFCRFSPYGSCWHFTFVTTRPLKVLYFDGSSAAKMQGGPMDSQDILIWGESKPDWTYHERERINDLCDWGRELGLDGFVRMEMDFEIMLCDFSNGLKLVSKLNLASPSIDIPSRPHNSTLSTSDDISRIITTVLEAGSWHNHYPGDPRIKLDLSRLISFYDTSLVPSLIPLRHGQHRYEHRLEGITLDDLEAVRKTIAGTLTREEKGSDIDWKGLLRVITLRYADRLELIHHLLNSTEAEKASRSPLDSAKLVQHQLRIMLTPYILNSAVPASIPSDTEARNHSWTAPVFKYCATTHTEFITSSSALFSRLSPSERLILGAINETNKEICRVIVKLWAEGVEEGLDPVLTQPMLPTLNGGRLERVLSGWRVDVDQLVGWLDWSTWIKCRPACSIEEMCYLPTWPFFEKPRRRRPGGLDRPPGASGPPTQIDELSSEDDDLLIPQPKCVRLVEPYSFTGPLIIDRTDIMRP